MEQNESKSKQGRKTPRERHQCPTCGRFVGKGVAEAIATKERCRERLEQSERREARWQARIEELEERLAAESRRADVAERELVRLERQPWWKRWLWG